jgi:hypothetical protein
MSGSDAPPKPAREERATVAAREEAPAGGAELAAKLPNVGRQVPLTDSEYDEFSVLLPSPSGVLPLSPYLLGW